MPPNEVVLDAAPELRFPRRFMLGAVRDLGAIRELAWELFLQNIRGRYRQSVLGYVWLLVTPLSIAAVWIFLRSSRIVSFAETTLPYPVYVVSGLFLWQSFLRILNGPLQQLNASRHWVTKIRFPWESILLAAWGEALFDVLIYLVVLAAMFVAFDVQLVWSMLLAVPAITAFLLLGAGLGMLIAPFALLYDDAARALGMGTFLLFFLTPIVYPPPTEMPLVLALLVNPIGLLLVTARDALTLGAISHAPIALAYAAGALLLFFLAWFVFRLSVPHVTARL